MACTGTLAGTLRVENPFRYRGYVFDVETGWYYLRSRYYAPEWGRFVNADLNLGAVGGALSHNSFTYCLNSVICLCDPDGKVALTALFVTLGAAAVKALMGTVAIGLTAVALGSVSDAASKIKTSTRRTTSVKSTTVAVPQAGSRPMAEPSSTARPMSVPISSSRVDEYEDETVIYRSGGHNFTTLTPRETDSWTAMSFYLIEPKGKYYSTTIETLNDSGVFTAVIDGADHVSVRLVDMSQWGAWIDSRPTAKENPHPLSILLLHYVSLGKR